MIPDKSDNQLTISCSLSSLRLLFLPLNYYELSCFLLPIGWTSLSIQCGPKIGTLFFYALTSYALTLSNIGRF